MHALGSEDVHEFIRYTIASLIALTIDLGLLWALTTIAQISYLLSGAIAFGAGLVTIYFLSVYWVFGERRVHNRGAEFVVFAGIGLFGLFINEFVLYVCTALFGMYFLLSKIVSVAIVFTWNFAARKWLLFRTNAT